MGVESMNYDFYPVSAGGFKYGAPFHEAFGVRADNQYEAEGKAKAVADRKYPTKEGYFGIHVVVGSPYPVEPDQ